MDEFNIHVKPVSNGGCNFCSRGKYTPEEGFSYPYQKVIEVNGSPNLSLTVRLCQKCATVLYNWLGKNSFIKG